MKPVQQAQQQVEAGKQEVRTESPFEQDLVLGNEENRQMSNNSSSSRTPYFPGQPQQHVSGPPNKRRRLPGSEPGIAGDEYGQFMPSLPDIYDGYPGQGRMPQMMVGNGAGNGAEHSGMIGMSSQIFAFRARLTRSADVDRKFMPSENPFIPMDPALDPFRSREPPTYLDPQQQQQQRNWSLMHDQSGAMQQSQQIQLQHPSFQQQTQMHRHSLPNARPGTAGTHGIVRARDFAAHPAGEVVTGAVVTPGSMTEGSVGTTGTTGAGVAVSGSTSASQQHARPTTSGGTSGNRGKGKIMYTQPLSISPSGMSGGSGPPLSAVSGGFHTSSERSTRHGPEHAGYAHLPHQVAHPQTAPAYREYGSYLSYERDVHDVGAGPIVVGPSSSESGGSDPARALLAPLPERSGDGVEQGDGVRGAGGGGDDAERRAMMRNSMALTSILDDMKKDLRGPATSSERDRNRHHHHSHGNGQRDGAGKDRQDGAMHAADYVTQEGSLDSRRDHSDPGSGGGGGSAQMDIGERYNAMDIAEREQRLASALDVGSVGIGGGGPIGLEIVPPNGSNTTATTIAQKGESVGERGRSGQHLEVPGQQHQSAMASTHGKRNFRGRVGIVDDDLRARQRERELQRLESEKTEGMEDPVTLGILDQDDVAFLFEW